MTDLAPAQAPTRPAAARGRRPGTGVAPAMTWLTALTMFTLVLVLLAWRMLSGQDPVVGAAQSPTVAPAATPAKRVVVRRIIKRRIVVTNVAPATSAPGGAPAPADAPVSVASAPAARASAPAPAAPPAPAPAPVTRSS